MSTSAAPYSPVPLDPPSYGGRQLGKLAVVAKARVAQLTGSRSITAAAELSVTLRRCFYRLEARLLGVWGSSSAQGDGVR